jgi:hypothetical protein
MTALRRMTMKFLGGSVAALSLAVAAPAFAQDNDAPIDVTAAPPPSAETVGPSQLRNFNLQGTVTRPAERPAATSAQPVSTAPARAREGDAVPSEAAQPVAPAASPPRATAPTNLVTPANGGGAAATADTVTPSMPSEVRTDPAPQLTEQLPTIGPSISPSDKTWSWPWIAALVALVAGGLFFAWTRRGRSRRRADPGRMAFAGLAREAGLGGAADAESRALPRPDPVPPRGQPAPAPASQPIPAAKPKPVIGDSGLIVSTALKPELNVQLLPDRVVVNEREVMLQFDVVLSNSGSAPARDVLVEARLVTAHAGQDNDIAEFFQAPVGTGDRIPSLAPFGKISLKSVVRLPLAQLHAFEAGGRRLFVPLVAFNILFRGPGGESQASASFLVGRGSEEDDKLAPFRLDLGPRIFRGLVARAHSIGLTPAA